jgi:hypothetical protein
MQVSKNITKGKEIKDLRELYSLAIKKQSVVVYCNKWWYVRPAGFMINWPLAQLVHVQLFYSVKSGNAIKSSQ